MLKIRTAIPIRLFFIDVRGYILALTFNSTSSSPLKITSRPEISFTATSETVVLLTKTTTFFLSYGFSFKKPRMKPNTFVAGV